MRDNTVTNPPLVSVIIPVYNGRRFIGAAIESALAQTYNPIEIIVVDDGSTDDSVSIVREYQQQDDRIQLICQANRGVAAARNTGIQNSKGTYVAPLDADDIWFPDKIEAQVEVMERSGPQVGLVYAWSAAIDESGKCTGSVNANHFEGQVFANILFGNFVGNGSAPLIRMECFERLGGYCEEFTELGAMGCEDRDLYLRIAEEFRYGVVRSVLVGYRHHDSNMSSDDRTMNRSHILTVRRLRQRRKILPARFLRRSCAFNALYLDRIATKQGLHESSALHVLRAALLYPGLLLEPGFVDLVRAKLWLLVRHSLLLRWLPVKKSARRGSNAVQPKFTIQDLELRVASTTPGWLANRRQRCSRALDAWLERNANPSLEKIHG